MKQRVIIPRDLYDAIELSAYAFGGIGAGTIADEGLDALDDTGHGVPVCLLGHLEQAKGTFIINPEFTMIEDAHRAATGSFRLLSTINDEAVRAINKRKGKPEYKLDERVSFEEYVEELGWVRGNF